MKRATFFLGFIFVILNVLCLSFGSAYAYPVKISKTNSEINIGLSVEYYEDRSASLTLKDIIRLDSENKFSSTPKVPLNFGYSPYTYWLSFSVFGETESGSGWVLDVPYAPLDYVTLYVPDGKGDYREYKSGDRLPFSVRQIKYKNPVFMLGQNLLPYQQYYIKVSSEGSINLPVFLWTGAGFTEHVNRFQTGMGIYFGLMLALVLYNIFLYFSVKDKDYVLCAFILTSYMLVQGSYYGMAGQFLWPNLIWWANNSLVIFAVLIFFSIAVFTSSFLKLQDYSKPLNTVMNFFIGYYFLLFFGIFMIGYRLTSVAAAYMGIVLIVAVFLTALVVYSRGYRPARFFLLAWTFFLLGMILLLLKLLGVLPHVFITEYSVHFGFLLNSLLLSLALADRINLLREDKETAQQEVLQHLEASERVKSEFLRASERLVEERTKELETVNEKLVTLASVDVLTGLANRRVFNEIVDKEFKRAKRQYTELSLILINVDYFRNYNEYYGNLEGDACLMEVSQIVSSCISRASDYAARHGGEEFAVVLCETDLGGAIKIAEDIRQKVEKACIPHKMSPLGYVSVSCGVVSAMPMIQDTLGEFLRKAHKALAEAKASGRNIVKSSIY